MAEPGNADSPGVFSWLVFIICRPWNTIVAMSDGGDIPFCIRSFKPEDGETCRRLYTDGLLGGKLSENDTCSDLDDIREVYLRHPGNHFWVAEAPGGRVVGMIGVQHYDEGVGEIRRLRVAAEYRRKGIGSALVETALRFCHDQQYLKLTVDTFMERDAATSLFRKFGFRHYRTREVHGKPLMYFLLDLYSKNQKEGSD
jgi:ribosomal protein S18 acetylase RimI-like enzyme